MLLIICKKISMVTHICDASSPCRNCIQTVTLSVNEQHFT